MAKYTYQDYKERISIIQVALELGYKFDRSKGRSQPSFVRYDGQGHEMDRIYVKNPQNNATQGYWRRNLTSGNNTGDLIGFVKENIREFPEYMTARNDVDAINKVLARMAGVVVDNNELMNKFMDSLKERPVKPFSLERYERDPGNVNSAMKFLLPRGIEKETAELFRNNFEMIRDKEGKADFKNLAFPFRKPGEEEIVGFEIRGFRGFKSKAEGSDSTHASWMAYIGDTPPRDRYISELHFAESALDVMAFVQLNKNQLNLDECLFISFGGSFSQAQMKGVLDTFPQARPVLHFDNDPTGVIYDCETACIMEGKSLRHTKRGNDILFTVGERSFSIPLEKLSFNKFREGSGLRPTLQLWKAPGGFKDWNDVTISQLDMQAKEGEKVAVNEKIEERKRGFSR